MLRNTPEFTCIYSVLCVYKFTKYVRLLLLFTNVINSLQIDGNRFYIFLLLPVLHSAPKYLYFIYVPVQIFTYLKPCYLRKCYYIN